MLIPQHMFRPWPLPPHYVGRDRIMQLLASKRQSQVILVMARAGCGKTLAVAEFAQQLSEPVAWYPLRSLEEKTPLLFLWNLVLAIRSALPGFGQQLEPLFHEAEQVAPQIGGVEKWLRATVLPALSTQVAAQQKPLWVVLDDYHKVRQAEIDQSFTDLLETAPENLHWIVTSRDLPQWAASWKGKEGSLAVISDETLVFAKSEVRDLAQQVGVPLGRDQLEQVYADIGGWPILHYYLYLHCRKQRAERVAETLSLLNRPSSVVYEFLAEELLQDEEPAIKDFLCRTAVLPQLDTEICNALLGIANAREFLNLLGDSVFLSVLRDSDNPILIHRHDIIRDFLQQVLRREYGEEYFRLHLRLGEIWEERDSWDQAISTYCSVQGFDRAIRLISDQAPNLISTADFVRLEAWLNNFPPERIEQEPILLTYKGVVLTAKKSPVSGEYLGRARELFKERADRENSIWAQIELGGDYWRKGKYTPARELLEPLVGESDLSAERRRQLLLYLAMVYYGLDLFAEAIRCWEEAKRLFDSSPASQRALSRHMRYVSFIYNVIGHPREAARLLHRAHRLARSLNMGDWSLSWIYNPLALTYQRMGRFAQAHACLDEADCLLAKYREAGATSELLDWVLITRGHLYRDTYDYEKAEDLYHQAGRGHPNGVFMALYLAQQSHTQEALAEAQRRWRDAQEIESPVARAKQEGVLGLAYLNAGDYARARTHLEHADRVLEHYQAGFDLISARIFLAKIYFAAQEYEQGARRLRYVLKWMREKGYYNLDFWVPQIIAEMCAQAIRLDIEADFAAQLAVCRLTAAYTTPFLPLVNDADSRVRARVVGILQNWGDVPSLQARLLLNKRMDELTRQRLVRWLDQHWLTEEGLLQLKSALSWREVEVFLLWIYPPNRGSVREIAETLTLGVDAINAHLRHIARKLPEAKLISPKLSGQGAHLEIYAWAVRARIVNPHEES